LVYIISVIVVDDDFGYENVLNDYEEVTNDTNNPENVTSNQIFSTESVCKASSIGCSEMEQWKM
jgi:hypothetical protein